LPLRYRRFLNSHDQGRLSSSGSPRGVIAKLLIEHPYLPLSWQEQRTTPGV
jgi:hypothetical protein